MSIATLRAAGIGACFLVALTHGALAQHGAASPVAETIARAETALAAIAAVPAEGHTFANTIVALDDLLARLDAETSMLQFMQYVSTDAAERERSTRAEKDVTNWRNDLFKRAELFAAVEALAARKPELSPIESKLLLEVRREFKRNGMALGAEQRQELTAIQKEIVDLGLQFQKNIREDETRVPLTPDELAGMPDDWLATLERSGDLYLLSMDYPAYMPVLERCRHESTRRKAFVAYKRRGGVKNVELIERLLELRTRAATLLGYQSAADYETEVRMAGTAKAVREFYDKLRPLVRAKAKLDFEEYQAAKRQETGNASAKLQPWDQLYYENWLRREKYSVDSEKVKEYFPFEAVMNGLFSITQSLYGLEYKDVTARAGSQERPLWHPDVRLYEVWDKKRGELIGEFYIDLFPRPNKYTHAACWGLVLHKRYGDGQLQKPLAALVCNFPKPSGGKPALFPHKDVETFFHEFGHVLHNLLSEAEHYSFSGTNVARDFVEAPSQMFESWVWDAAVLATFAKHYSTGQPISNELVAAMVRSKNLGTGLWAERQFTYGLTDQAFHTAPAGKVDSRAVQEKIAGETELFEPVPGTYFHASFGHLIHYTAGYYGYMWSLVYASDMFQRFKQKGMLSPEAGQYYRSKILARGSTLPEMDMVKDYLGREPNLAAFLEHLGLEQR